MQAYNAVICSYVNLLQPIIITDFYYKCYYIVGAR